MKKKAATEEIVLEGAVDDGVLEVFENDAVIEEVTESSLETMPKISPETVTEHRGVWVYVGPSIRGIVTNGGIYHGTKSEVLSGLPDGWQKYPQIERLIVSDKSLAKAREQIRQSKGGITVAYNAVAAALAAKED